MMNELIRELEKQCWDNQTNHLDTEKFAELIVAECVDAIMTKDRYRREYFARVVQRRFGMLDDGNDDE
jgi:hypothetical protein